MPKSMWKSITVKAHDLSGHLSVEKSVGQIFQDYWFTKTRRYVRRHVNMYIECLMSKKPRGRQPGLLHPIPLGQCPFDTVHMDHVGPFVTTQTGNKYILVMVDNLTKFTCLFAAKDTSADGVIDRLTTLLQTFGLPNWMVTDRGTYFTGRKFEEFCDEKGIQHTLTSIRRPQANGQVERTNSIVLSMLLTQVTKEDEWDQWLPEVQRQINNSESKTCPDELWKEAREASEKAKEKMKEGYDLHRHNNTKYMVGEIVVMTTVPILPGDVYRVAQLQEDQKRLFTTTAHVSQLKSWRLEEELDETSSHDEEEDRGPNVATSSEDEDVQSLTERKSNNAEVKTSARVRRRPSEPVSFIHRHNNIQH
ncbi:hypothetical protein QTP88_027652 [Uroleucon formosanum]